MALTSKAQAQHAILACWPLAARRRLLPRSQLDTHRQSHHPAQHIVTKTLGRGRSHAPGLCGATVQPTTPRRLNANLPPHPATLSAGHALAGDTLFGQLCWTLRHQLGNDALTTLLEGLYTQGQPFTGVLDALPQGHLPCPACPAAPAAEAGSDRKVLKKRWLPYPACASSYQMAAIGAG